jgi:hypothetical protein
MNLRVAVLSSAVALLCGCELIDNWPNIPTHPEPGPGPGPGPSAGAIFIDNGLTLDYTVYEPQEKQNNPAAGDPSYVYLAIGREAVRLGANPVQDKTPSLFYPDRAAITKTAVGFVVRLNDRLSYVVEIDDFEGEVALSQVALRRVEAPGLTNLESSFIFTAQGGCCGGGVAHSLTIRPVVDGVPGGRSTPYSIESR